MSDDLASLALQLEWGVDEALEADPLDRLRTVRASDPALPPAPPASAAPARGPIAAGTAAPIGHAARAEQLARSATDLDALAGLLAGFDGSALSHTAENLVFGEGRPDAELVVIAEAPGAEDDASGRPLSGAVGAYLDRMLGSIGLRREAIRVACLVPWRPPGDRPPSAAEIAVFRPFLHAQLRLLDARHHLLLGATVAGAVAEARGTTRKLRGSVLPLRIEGLRADATGLVMTPPAQLMREPSLRRDAWRDLLALRSALDAGFDGGAGA